MGSPIKVALLLLLGARATATNRTFRAVIFKEARTGSTWLADLLRNERSVGYFAHEASSCVKNGDGALQRQALFSLLAAPACDMRCGVQARDAARLRWLADERRPAPPCFAGKLVGFDIQAKNDLGEVKAYKSPPGPVKTCMEAVNIMLDEKTDWDTAKKVLGGDLLGTLKNYDKDNIKEAHIKKIAKNRNRIQTTLGKSS